jgi:hypothetical protein
MKQGMSITKMARWLNIAVAILLVTPGCKNESSDSVDDTDGPVETHYTYPIVDTGQKTFYNNREDISEPSEGEAFYGQDAHVDGNQPAYLDNGDGTITDRVTGLMWQKSPDANADGEINAESILFK